MIKKFIFFNKLNESPDSIFFDGKEHTYKSDDAVPFSIFRNLKTDEYFLYVHNKKGVTHNEMQYVPYENERIPEYEKLWNIFYGRLWLNSKVISFWKIPLKNRTEGKNILDIEQYYSEKLPSDKENDIDVFNYYMKDLKSKLVKRGFIGKNEDMKEWHIETSNQLDFIKVKDFSDNFTPNEDELKYHLMKSDDKNRKFRTKNNFGNVDDSKPLNWKQALLKSEKYNVIFENNDGDESELLAYEKKNGIVTGKSMWLKSVEIRDLIINKFITNIDYNFFYNKNDVKKIENFLQVRNSANKYNI